MHATVPLSDILDVESSVMGRTLRLVIGGSHPHQDVPARILYVVDPAYYAHTCIDLVRSLGREGDAIMPTLVVGVGIPLADDRAYVDYTLQVRNGLLVPEDEGISDDIHRAYPGQPDPQAGVFLSAITDEVDAIVRERHATVPGPAAIFGHSYGALFTAFVLAEQPPAIRDVAMISPGMANPDSRLLARLLAAPDGSLEGRVFMSIASGENVWDAQYGGAIGVAYHRLAADLAGGRHPGIDLKTAEVAEENHGTVPYRIAHHALRWLLRP